MTEQAIEWHQRGAGSPCTLLPGWGQGPAAMAPLVAALAPSHQVSVPAWPGMGASRPERCGGDTAALADALAPAQAAPASLIGWSLGGLIALATAARHPDRVRRVVLLAATPRFISAEGWPGVDPALFDRFAGGVDADPAGARDRFLSLQVAAGAGQRQTVRRLRWAAARDGEPDASALQAGLALLRTLDLRAVVPTLRCPIDAILAGADPLVPVGLAPHLRTLGVRTRVIAGLGHAPLVTDPETVARLLAEIELERG